MDKSSTTNEQHQQVVGYLPLTWNESRSRLRHTLIKWNNERRKIKQNSNDDINRANPPNNIATGRTTRLQWISNISRAVDNPDMICMTIPLSLLFVILSFALSTSTTSEHMIQMQQAASLLFLISSLISIWITRRRRKISNDIDKSIERRRCVKAFLEGMKCRENECYKENNKDEVRTSSQQQHQQQTMPNINVDTIPRKNVEDVYSTYRINVNNHNCQTTSEDEKEVDSDSLSPVGYWHRIPTLLLVKGDFIALKVGDTIPAKCTPLITPSTVDATIGNTSSATISRSNKKETIIFKAGDRMTIASLSSMGKDTLGLDQISSGSSDTTATTTKGKKGGLLPPGRSTLKQHSEEMLLLANGLQIFVLLETPLDSFLRKECVEKNDNTPQILRQGEAIRVILSRFAVVVFIITIFILLVRPKGAQNFFQSTTYTLPLLAALGVLPVVTPLFLFWVECIGISRILASVHPLSSNQKRSKSGGDNNTSVYRQSSVMSLVREHSHTDNRHSGIDKPSAWLLCRYLMATSTHRLFTKSLIKRITSWGNQKQRSVASLDALLSIPPATTYLLEKLGVVTALALVDDELACEPFSTPQQLLIPSDQGGFTLLDICPVVSDDAYSSDDDSNDNINSSRDFDSAHSDDSHDVTQYKHSFSAPARTLRRIKKYRGRKKSKRRKDLHQNHQNCMNVDDEVQFEDPNWWKHLPSLKSIGLGCVLVEDYKQSRHCHSSTNEEVDLQPPTNPSQKVSFDTTTNGKSRHLTRVESSLVDHICCDQRERKQLQMLAHCIGFDTSPNSLGSRGDLSSFQERRRLHILSTNLLRQRMQLDSHALGLEESRNWSRLFTDADTVFVRDTRTGGDLLLSVGDARVITQLCPDWWQGENSTISPLTTADRNIINETQSNWMLSDMDVQAFSYAPLPYTADQKIEAFGVKGSHIYLLDNATPSTYASSQGFWGLVKNQIFLGLLGSSVRPRSEIEPLIDSCSDAGVRFVYFSPRNMRRTKELASQMGIDVAWNCAISLRPLEEGTDDSFRMTSNYADWDVNAKLPHGVEEVKKHLEDVDNVPLLVSLYTDCTKQSAADMVNVFMDYKDTVLSVGLSHLPGNQDIFSRADLAIGVDVLAEDVSFSDNSTDEWNTLQPDEVAFISRISAHSSVFNLFKSTSHLNGIIRIGRACLEAATSGVTFVISGLLSFSIFIMLCSCTAATAVPQVPTLGSFLYTQILLPIIGLSLVSTDESKEFMTRVPPKNDNSVSYSLRSNGRKYLSVFLGASFRAIIPQFLYLIVLGELMWAFDPQFVENNCLADDAEIPQKPPISTIIRCDAMQDYSGPATESAGTITLASLAICTCLASASFAFSTESIRSEPPWRRNQVWVGTLVSSFILIIVYLSVALAKGSMTSLSWYFYLYFVITPFISLWFSEQVKKMDTKREKRAVMMRRLQFETRLGMVSSVCYDVCLLSRP